MVELPQITFREKDITFEQFCDVLHIGTAGYSDDLFSEGPPYQVDGMINYKIVADSLGLKYENDWLDGFSAKMQNRIDSLLSHDSAPEGVEEDGYWAYMNSGFLQIGELLKEKYYRTADDLIKTYEEFKHIFLIDLAGLMEAGIGHDGHRDEEAGGPSYDLKKTLEFLDIEYSTDWGERLRADLIQEGIVKPLDDGTGSKYPLFRMTMKGYETAQKLSEEYGRDGFMLAATGASNLFFSVDASHISRLGLELVAKQETAVAELVKNGYDADATNVDLIVGTDTDETFLEILDNGVGMTLSDLESGFMRLSTQSKVASPVSKVFKRQKAGRKGIGRFAAQRLGRRLTLETTTENSKFGLKLEIDWEKFEAKQTLSDVPSKITRIPKPFEHGTKLTIVNLRDDWSNAQIERSYRHISELIQPFPLSKTVGANDGVDAGFKASFAREHLDDLEIIADDWTQYFQHAIAEIDGVVNSEGVANWSLKSDKFNLDIQERPISSKKEDPSAPYQSLRDIKFKVYYFIDKELQRSVRGKVGNKLSADGGVRLYRNGFRVLPYGARYDDWLKLNASNLMRSILPPHSNRNFLGFVEIKDVKGDSFEETSSREGLLENQSFSELKDFVQSALKTAVLPIAEAREKESTTTKTRQRRRTPKGQAEEILEKLNALQSKAADDPEYAEALSEVMSVIQESVIALGETGESILQELEMMRVLASLGITIGEFTHEIGISMEAIKASAKLLSSKNRDLAKASAIEISSNISDFEGYLNYFDNTVRENVSRGLDVIEIRDVVKSFLKVLEPKIKRQQLTVFHEFNGHGLFMKPMHKSEWSSILINLFTNSLKAIQRSGVNGKIGIVCGKSNGKIYLEFMDNGDGIDKVNSERVFDPFFTTTMFSGTSGDDDSLSGMGLGLKIVQDIVNSASGRIFVTPAIDGYSTCFRVEIPAASKDELPENAY